MRGLVYLLFLLIGSSVWATNAKVLVMQHSQDYALLPFCQIFEDTTNRLDLPQIVDRFAANQFQAINPEQAFIQHHRTYWLRFEVLNCMQNDLQWMLCFNSQISHVKVYSLAQNSPVLLPNVVPLQSVAINNIQRNKIAIPLCFAQKTAVYVCLRNQILIDASIANLSISPPERYMPQLSMHGFLVGITFGGYVIIFIFSIFLCFTQKKKEFIFYSLYIFFNAVFAVFGSFLTDKYLFASNPWMAFNLHSTIIIGHIFYIIFIRLFIEPQNIPIKIDRYIFKPFIVFMVVVNLAVTFISFIDVVLFKILLDCSLLFNAGFGLFFTFVLFRIRLRVVRFILIGTCVMIVAGLIGQLVDMFDLWNENYFYNLGVLVELLFFTYAINYKQKLANDERQQKEFDLAVIKNDLAGKNRELTQKAMYLGQQEQMLNSLKAQLEEIKGESPQTNKALLKTLSDIEMYINQSSWEDFEKYFTEVHPDFYKTLLQKHPDLSQNELRVCAMLKLALNTKEIAAISGKTPKSIDITRNRIRHKMGLQREDNLFAVLAQF